MLKREIDLQNDNIYLRAKVTENERVQQQINMVPENELLLRHLILGICSKQICRILANDTIVRQSKLLYSFVHILKEKVSICCFGHIYSLLEIKQHECTVFRSAADLCRSMPRTYRLNVLMLIKS